MLGGISSGQDLEVSIAIKPTSSIASPRESVNLQGEAIKCRSIKNGGYNSTYIEALLRNRYTPATCDGHPFESEYVERYTIQGDYPG